MRVAAVAFGSAAAETVVPAISTRAPAMVGKPTVFRSGMFAGDRGEGSYFSPRATWARSGQRRSVNSYVPPSSTWMFQWPPVGPPTAWRT